MSLYAMTDIPLNLTPEALRAARAILKIGVRELADRAGVSWMTISQAENGRTLRPSTEAKIMATLEKMGVEVIASSEATGAKLIYSMHKGEL